MILLWSRKINAIVVFMWLKNWKKNDNNKIKELDLDLEL